MQIYFFAYYSQSRHGIASLTLPRAWQLVLAVLHGNEVIQLQDNTSLLNAKSEPTWLRWFSEHPYVKLTGLVVALQFVLDYSTLQYHSCVGRWRFLVITRHAPCPFHGYILVFATSLHLYKNARLGCLLTATEQLFSHIAMMVQCHKVSKWHTHQSFMGSKDIKKSYH